MGEVEDIVKIYIEESDIVEDKSKEIANSLQKNIRSNLWKGHGYDTGQLYRDISSNSGTSGNIGVVVGWYTVDYGQYVDQGHHSWKGIQFMKKGLDKTLEMYK
jgi:hypothetical protein